MITHRNNPINQRIKPMIMTHYSDPITDAANNHGFHVQETEIGYYITKLVDGNAQGYPVALIQHNGKIVWIGEYDESLDRFVGESDNAISCVKSIGDVLQFV